MEIVKSRYTIITDSFYSAKFGQEVRVVYNTRTARAMIVTAQVYEQLMNNDFDQLSFETLEQLTEIEAIVPAGEDELNTVVQRNHASIKDDVTLNFIIQPTAQCQLGCDYCGQQHTKKAIGQDYYDKILQRIEFKLQNGHYKHLQISWFGAEPLMGWKNIQELTPLIKALGARYNCSYSALVVTNGLSLKENIFHDLVTKYAVNFIEVTLDGTATAHDARRHTKEGRSTYDLIFRNLLQISQMENFADYPVELSIRCNVDHRNKDSVVPLIHELAAHGLQEKMSFYIAPIHSWGNDAHLLSLTKEAYANYEIDWIIEMARHNFKLSGLIPGRKEIVCVSVSNDAEVIDAYGNIFNCTEVPYVPVYDDSHYLLGNLKHTPADVQENKRVYQDWNERVLNDNITCSSCRMLPVCGGMCPKSWAEGNAACPSNKLNIEDKLILAHLYTNEGLFN